MSILKVIVHSFLFLLLSPGVILTLYPGEKGMFFSSETNYMSMILHTFLLTFLIVSFEEKRYLDPHVSIQTQLTRVETRDIVPIITVLLFVLLTPGLIFTLPDNNMGVLFSKQTNIIAVIVHTLLFIFFYGLLTFALERNKSLFSITSNVPVASTASTK